MDDQMQSKQPSVAVIGGGSFGTALVKWSVKFGKLSLVDAQ